MRNLPTSHADKLAYLQAGARHGAAIEAAAQIGAPADALRAYAAGAPDLALSAPARGQLLVRYGEQVVWEVRVDQHDLVLGCGFSGFGELMAALGIDFSGQPYAGTDGNGNGGGR